LTYRNKIYAKMKILVKCGLVNDRKEGKWHHYSLNSETLKEYRDFIEELSCADSKKCCCDGGLK